MCQIEGSQGSRQKALDLDPEKIAIRSILGSARPRPSLDTVTQYEAICLQ